MKLCDFDFCLPQNLIAQAPLQPRGSSRLLYFKDPESLYDRKFEEVCDLLAPGDVLVFNNTKVIPVLLTVQNINQVPVSNLKITLVKNLSNSVWQVLAKPAQKIKEGDILYFCGKGRNISATVIKKYTDENYILIQFQNQSSDDLLSFLTTNGAMPLPPYIKRKQNNYRDLEDYQTIFASDYGAVAAPTAGLHFNQNLLDTIAAKGVAIQFITLHVGLGTFTPIRADNIEEHKMHSENFSVSHATCNAINDAKKNGKKVVCVGTTTLRALESAAASGTLHPQTAETSIFIKPGYKFQIADALITNFHLPKSTLLILIAAFCGFDNTQKIYHHAIKEQYRFFSYGDACYLTKMNC